MTNSTLTLEDSGSGMTENELVSSHEVTPSNEAEPEQVQLMGSCKLGGASHHSGVSQTNTGGTSTIRAETAVKAKRKRSRKKGMAAAADADSLEELRLAKKEHAELLAVLAEQAEEQTERDALEEELVAIRLENSLLEQSLRDAS